MDASTRLSLTPTIARQTPRTEFGALLKQGLEQGAVIAGSLMHGLPAAGIMSAAVSSVTALASSGAAAASASGITSVGLAGVPGNSVAAGGSVASQALASSPGNPGELGGMIGQMRAEADRSLALQVQMQNESREYNAVSNVLKTRHDSAKAAINNIR